MSKIQTLKIDAMVIITTKPTTILKEIERVLRKYAGKDWTYDFKLEN